MADIGPAGAADISPGCIDAQWFALAGVPAELSPGCLGGEKAGWAEPEKTASAGLPAAWKSAALGAGGFIGPVSAAMALARGEAWSEQGGGLVVGGLVLIGPAGKTFAFSSAEAAAKWVELNMARPAQEWALIGALPAAAAATAMQKKAAALAKIAGRVVAAAAKQQDGQKKAAMLAEADFCLGKWAF